MSRVVCPCSAVVEIIDDGKDNEYVGECTICVSNHGEYNKSPAWKEALPISEETLEKVREKYKKEAPDARRPDKGVSGVRHTDTSRARTDRRK